MWRLGSIGLGGLQRRFQDVGVCGLLGGSWVVISGVISPLIWVRTIDIRLITLLITTHEPQSRVNKPGPAKEGTSLVSPDTPLRSVVLLSQRVQSTHVVECRICILGIGIMIWATPLSKTLWVLRLP